MKIRSSNERICSALERGALSPTRRNGVRTLRAAAAFTMLEIAIALAVIAFALVAIVGVLPMGLNVQKDNREDTIANLDGPYVMELIRHGARGEDLLIGEHVTNINVIVSRNADASPPYITYSHPSPGRSDLVIGLLSLPKYSLYAPGEYVVRVEAAMVAMSGMAAELSGTARDEMGFTYRLISEVIPFAPTPPNNNSAQALGLAEIFTEEERAIRASSLEANLHELRLTMRWPLLPNDRLGRGRQVLRTIVSGQQAAANINGTDVKFFEPQQYVQAP
jgi:hypothetical protein